MFFKSTILIFISALTLSGCFVFQDQKIHEWKGQTMGTYYRVKVHGKVSESQYKKIQNNLDKLLVDINQQMSTYIPESEISRFNKQKSELKVSEYFAQTVRLALELSEFTQGSFDPTVGPLVNLWGFGPNKTQKVPIDEQIQLAKNLVGYGFLSIDQENTLKKTSPIFLDLSAIAKGKAVDILARYLSQQKYPNYFVEIGGEVRAHGSKGNEGPWMVGIESPSKNMATQSIQMALALNDMAIATSGNYRNYFEVQGQLYSHTIDPRTGRPVQHHLASVSVLDRNCTRADGLATALMVMGEERGFEFAEENSLKAFFIYFENGEFKTKMTSSFQDYKTRNN